MPDVVQQRREADRQAFLLAHAGKLVPFLERSQCPTRQVIGAERVLETGVGGAGIDQEGVPQLAHVPEPLHRGRIDDRECSGVKADVVPERVANDLEVTSRLCHGRDG